MKQINIILKSKNMTVQQLSKESGVSIGYISDLKNGKAKNPSLTTLRKLATALEVDVSELLQEDNNKVTA